MGTKRFCPKSNDSAQKVQLFVYFMGKAQKECLFSEKNAGYECEYFVSNNKEIREFQKVMEINV